MWPGGCGGVRKQPCDKPPEGVAVEFVAALQTIVAVAMEKNMIAGAVRFMWRWSRGVRVAIIGNVACGCCAAALSLTAVWLTREIVGAACAGGRDGLGLMCAGFCFALAGRILASKCGGRLEAWSITRMSNAMRSRLFRRVMGGGYGAGAGLHSADVVNRLTADVGSVSSAVCSSLPSLVVAAVSFLAAFAYLAVLAPGIAAAVALLMPGAVALGKLPARRTFRLTAEIRDAETDIYRLLQEDVGHRMLISTIGYSGKAAEEFGDCQERFFSLTMRRNDLGLLAGGAVAFGFVAGYAVMFLYCAYGILDATVSFATMTALLQLTAMVQRPVVDMSHKLTPLVKASVSASRVSALEAAFVIASGAGVRYGEGIVFDDVWFRYGEAGEYVLKGFHATVPVGKVTALYGETGIGKTTILRLLLGLCRPERGEVRSPFAGASLRRIVYVPQGNSLVSGTVMSNLLMGDPDAPDDVMEKALFVADAQFVCSLPEGLATKCGENGYGFSEGQAQRIAVARGIVRLMSLKAESDAPVMLLMDEPTSALDSETGNTMLRRIVRCFADVTLVIVTHNESIRSYADKVILL